MPGKDKPLVRSFYQVPAEKLAPALLGTILVRQTGNRLFRARIVETEAYVGTHDLACHAARGRTKRTEIMFGPAGFAYVYLIYGMHHMLNIVASQVDDAQAVLIRGAVPLDEWKADLSGPGKLARQFGITREHNGWDLTLPEFCLHADETDLPVVQTTKRIGIDYAGEWKDKLLRFIDTRFVKR